MAAYGRGGRQRRPNVHGGVERVDVLTGRVRGGVGRRHPMVVLHKVEPVVRNHAAMVRVVLVRYVGSFLPGITGQ